MVNPIVEKVSKPEPATKEETNPTLYYVIEKGDFIYRICRQFNMSLNEFINMNRDYFTGRDLDYVYPGEVVEVRTPNK
ncbi:LysM peptidoglycan-binding domain-containing protein [Shewanella seohaensis]|uniref:LysM peptidoglycan-binding domain-containing protein n=1 Tax=Shewanella seohaensis TaxID=755175 RepID=UPI0035B97538